MMPVVRINDATFANISTLKTWFGTKSPSETIDRIVTEVMEQIGIERDDETDNASATSTDSVRVFGTAPSLAFTKPKKATINGEPVNNPNWSSILISMIGHVCSKGLKGQELVRELSVPAKALSYEDEGYRYYPELGISLQGQSASDAWKEVDRLASKWRLPVTVEFEWRQNPKAKYPGKTGVLQSGN